MRLPADMARQWLATAPVVRMASVDAAGWPHVVPMTFAVAGDRIYSAVDHKPKSTRSLQRLRNIQANPRVAVLADHYASDWERLWWVRADGRAEIIETDEAMARPIALLAERYAQYREHRPAGPVIMVTVERWTGWASSTMAGPADDLPDVASANSAPGRPGSAGCRQVP